MFEAILAAMLELPVCHLDRDWIGKRAQLEEIAHVIADVSAHASDPVRRSAELVTVGYWESRFCHRVQLRPRRRAGNGYWQLETYIGWVTGPDPQALYMGAWNASLWLERAKWCGRRPVEVFTAYAGRPCEDVDRGWPTLSKRGFTFKCVRERIIKWQQQNRSGKRV